MGPRLVSLALLLLALCRTSSAGGGTDLSAITKNMPADRKAAVEAKEGDLLVLIVAMLAVASKTTPKVEIEKITLETGVKCAKISLKGTLKELLYGAGAQRPASEDKAAAELGIKCDAKATTPEWDCYCGDQKETIYYCLLHMYKLTGVAGKCKAVALADLKAVAPTLGLNFDYDSLAKSDKNALKAVFSRSETSIDEITKQLDAAITNFFCEAIKPETEAAMRDLYLSDVSYQIVETVVVALGFGKDGTEALANSCKHNTEWKGTPFGKCVCAQDKGFTFCVYQALGLFFKELGFLECTSKKFVPEKKPAASALPQIIPPPSSPAAAASSLLLAPTAAAMLLLLRH